MRLHLWGDQSDRVRRVCLRCGRVEGSGVECEGLPRLPDAVEEANALAKATRERDEARAEADRLRGAYALAVKAAKAASGGSGHNHWDRTMMHGAGCELCRAQSAARGDRDRLLAAAERSLHPYVVGNGLYCEEVARYATFDEAPEHYRRLPTPKPGEMRAIGITNEDEADGAPDGNNDGLTDEERERL